MSPALEADFFTTEPPGKPQLTYQSPLHEGNLLQKKGGREEERGEEERLE